jgi:hypothetical protein
VIVSGVCPFEGCRLGAWTAREDVPLYTSPSGNLSPVKITRGQAVTAVEAEVSAAPRQGKVTRVYDTDSQAGIKVGDVAYGLYPIGEGAIAVWHDAKVKNGSLDLTLDYDEPLATRPLQWTWWVRVRLGDGTEGWLKHPLGKFDGMDALG